MRWTPPAGRVLALAPHPDDETLGCGGALIRHRRRGDPVGVVVATDGRAGDPRGLVHPRDPAAVRRREARAAARILGVSRVEFWDYPDGGLAPTAELTERIARLLRVRRPRVLYRPGSDDPHPDHRALGLAAERALRRVRLPLLDCRYEVWAAPRPNAVLDISRDFSRKERALAAYGSQRHYLDLARMARRLNASRGLFLGRTRYAEGFRVRDLG